MLLLFLSLIPHATIAREDAFVVRAESSIERANMEYVAALVAGDARRFSNIFAIDGASQPARGPIVRGRDRIRRAMSLVFERFQFVSGKLRTEETRVYGNIAYEVGRYHFAIESDGVKSSLDGRYVVVWHLVDDVWRIDFETSSGDIGDGV